MPSSRSERFHTIAVVVALAAVSGIVAFLVLRPDLVAQRAPGVVQPTEIKIAPEAAACCARQSPQGRACARVTWSPNYPTPSSKRGWCWRRRSSGRRAPRATASMPARARNRIRTLTRDIDIAADPVEPTTASLQPLVFGWKRRRSASGRSRVGAPSVYEIYKRRPMSRRQNPSGQSMRSTAA